MANTPPTPPNSPNSPNQPNAASQRSGTPGNGSENTPGKPRATIMLKKNATPGAGSSPTIVPASGRVPGSSARITPAQSARRPAVTVDREALGLSSARPSEMVAGLNQVAKRAEALAIREESKRKSGGKMNANIALHVDDTGARWKRYVISGIVGAVALGALIFGVMFWNANRSKVSDRAAYEETRGILNELGKQAELMKPFDESETITVQGVKERLKGELEAALKEVKDQLKRDNEAKRNPDSRTVERRHFIEKLLAFQDGWRKPVVVSLAGRDEVEFGSTGKFDGAPPEPVKARVRSGSATPLEDAPGKK